LIVTIHFYLPETILNFVLLHLQTSEFEKTRPSFKCFY